MSVKVVLACVCCGLLAGSIGCQKTSQFAGMQPQRGVAGYSLKQEPIGYEVFGQDGPTVLVLAGIHGNEQGGVKLCEALSRRLQTGELQLKPIRLVVAAAVNPDGIAANRRYNAYGVDINRNFPGANRVNHPVNGGFGFSEPESRAVNRLLEQFDPIRVITLHEPLACIDYDGPGEAIAEAMAKVCELPVKKLGGRPGSMGTYVGEVLKRPIITMELPKGACQWTHELLWEKYGQALWTSLYAEVRDNEREKADRR